MDDDFDRLTAPFRRELLAHCYRMLGSTQEAEDLLQECLLRAWRSMPTYDPARSSLRTWLYRIATNACLTALETRKRRPLPAGLFAASDDLAAPLLPDFDVHWLQPFPDVPRADSAGRAADPAGAAVGRESLSLAFMAALQALSARQRAVLILREVLQFSAAEVAELLDVSVAAVNSGLQRARAAVRLTAADRETLSLPDEPGRRAVLDRYIVAFERADLTALTAILRDDVRLEMPPVPLWYAGREHYLGFLQRIFTLRPAWRALPISANGQPALAAYALGPGGEFRAHSVQVLDVQAGLVTHNVTFVDPTLFPMFGLPALLGPDDR